MARKKSKSKKAAQRKQNLAENDYGKAPHTFVFNRGRVGKNGLQLMLDTRQMMEPYTASSLRARKKNTLKDFVGVAGPLGVSHFLSYTKTDSAIHMRIMRLPRGPTLTFKVHKYTLAKDVVSSLRKPSMYASQFLHHPLLILNNFNGNELRFKLMTTMFQNMFPSINVNKIHLNDIRRCVLLNYNAETERIEFRHYSIKAVPMGMSRSTKKLLQSKVPNLGRYQDVSDFFLNTGQLSESEAELDGEHNEVTLPQRLASRGNLDNQKSAIRLIEIGPRLQLGLIKIEEGLGEGEVLYHESITKTKEEISAAREVKFRKKIAKIKRKKQQEANVAKKQQENEENKTRSIQGMKRKYGKEDGEGKNEGEDEEKKVEEDDDRQYYRDAVGEEPDAGLFPKKRSKSSEGTRGRGRGTRGRGESRGRGDNKRQKFGSQDRSRGGSGERGGGGGRGRGVPDLEVSFTAMRFIDDRDLRQWVQENLQRKLVQQAHELAVQTGCEVLVRFQDGRESPHCKYYVTDRMKHDYVNYGVRADPGDLPMSGESGLPKKYVHDFTCQVACEPTGPIPYAPEHTETHEAEIIRVQQHPNISVQGVHCSEEWQRLYRERLWTQQTSTSSTSKLEAAIHSEVQRRSPGANGQRPYVYPASALIQSDASVPTATESHIVSHLDDNDAALRNLKQLHLKRLMRREIEQEAPTATATSTTTRAMATTTTTRTPNTGCQDEWSRL
ncbi:suppressor of SWI4 1 homolog [Strongylocentrotus purpuratus]|uniref:Brix domain-containing protein n=1 Tax=Strongylocentrotus purpuratus TaxID=7668 RepID=A0A7M7PLQ2_STRPU|nr:suppressor of SWI4 1 homolog [Strongylocentrotus purpuratus]